METSVDVSALKEELAHVSYYLEIKKAQFEGRLDIQFDVPDDLLNQVVPVFTLQPIVENAIKHGASEMLGRDISYSESKCIVL